MTANSGKFTKNSKKKLKNKKRNFLYSETLGPKLILTLLCLHIYNGIMHLHKSPMYTLICHEIQVS